MSSVVRASSRPIPMLAAPLAAILLLLAACTSEAGSSTAGSASASTEASAEESSAASAEESADESEGGGDGETVTITGTSFGTDELTVAAGTTVRFINDSSLPHTVTEGTDGNAADDASFNENVAAGEWVEVTFDEVGDVDVTCLFHGNMNMVVHVE